MTTPTAAPASPQPERKPPQQPPPTYVGRAVRDDGVTVERWERPVTAPVHARPKTILAQERPVAYDLDSAADEVDLIAEARIDQRRASAQFPREAQRSAKAAKFGGVSLWTVFTWLVVFGGVGYTLYGQWSSGVYPQTQPSRNSAAVGGGSSPRGTSTDRGRVNRCRELLMAWIRSGAIGSMHDDEIATALAAIEEDSR